MSADMLALAATSPAGRSSSAALALIRARGGAAVRFALRNGSTVAVDYREADGYKLRFPRTPARRPEAVVINTGGGVAGGDTVELSAALEDAASAAITTPAAERVYGAADLAAAVIEVKLSLGDGASLAWLPQETILFNGARLQRQISVDMAGSARLVLLETLVFGRQAMGEALSCGAVIDRWTIRRNGELVLTEAVRLEGDMAGTLQTPASAGGARVVSTLLYVAPDATDLLQPVRTALADHEPIAAASAWNGLLVVRVVAHDSETVRGIHTRLVPLLSGHPPPRVWAN